MRELKKFLKNLFIFGVIFSFICITVLAFSFLFLKSIDFKIDNRKNILILGDSHTQTGINDKILDRSFNFSTSASSYLFSYAKLLKVIEDNKQIDTLILSFHYGSLDGDIDQRVLFNDTLILDRVPSYIPFLRFEEMQYFTSRVSFFKSFLYLPKVLSFYFLKSLVKRDFSFHNLDLGGYNNLDRFKLKEDIKRRESFGDFPKKDSISYLELDYLIKISDLCKEKNIKLLLINTPMYNAGKYTDTSFYYKNYKKFLSNEVLLDYASMPFPDSCYGDISHLNYNGAKIFTEKLHRILESKEN